MLQISLFFETTERKETSLDWHTHLRQTLASCHVWLLPSPLWRWPGVLDGRQRTPSNLSPWKLHWDACDTGGAPCPLASKSHTGKACMSRSSPLCAHGSGGPCPPWSWWRKGRQGSGKVWASSSWWPSLRPFGEPAPGQGLPADMQALKHQCDESAMLHNEQDYMDMQHQCDESAMLHSEQGYTDMYRCKPCNVSVVGQPCHTEKL